MTSHEKLAARIASDLMNLDLLGRWPAGERARWVMWSLDHGAGVEILARVLNVTNERVRQIRQQELRRRNA